MATSIGLIPEDPYQKVKVKKYTSKKGRAFSFYEQNAVLNSFIPKYAALFYFLSCTGLRIGEFLSLTVSDVFESEYYLLIDSSKSAGIEGETKNGETRRVPFIPELFDITNKILGHSIFQEKYSYRACNEYFKDHLQNLNFLGLTIHSTRHTFASVCYYVKIPDKMTQAWLGHKTIAMTLDIYTELLGEGNTLIVEYFKKLKNSKHCKRLE